MDRERKKKFVMLFMMFSTAAACYQFAALSHSHRRMMFMRTFILMSLLALGYPARLYVTIRDRFLEEPPNGFRYRARDIFTERAQDR